MNFSTQTLRDYLIGTLCACGKGKEEHDVFCPLCYTSLAKKTKYRCFHSRKHLWEPNAEPDKFRDPFKLALYELRAKGIIKGDLIIQQPLEVEEEPDIDDILAEEDKKSPNPLLGFDDKNEVVPYHEDVFMAEALAKFQTAARACSYQATVTLTKK